MNIATITALHTTIAASSIFRIDGATIDLPAALIALADAVHAMDHTDDSTESMWSTVGEHTECPLNDLITGAYWALSQWHGGQASDTYAALCALGRIFHPGCTSGPEPESGEDTVFTLINRHFDELHNAPEPDGHTPGPWIASDVPTIENGLTSWHVFAPVRNGYVIARTGQSNIDETLKAAQANARLIAAAPELLAALRGLMSQAAKDAEGYAPDGSEPIWAWISDASDIIAKATGH